MIYRKLKSLILDFRLDLFKCHVGIRIRPLPRSWYWFPYGVWPPTCWWIGPVEFTFCRVRDWFDIYGSLTLDLEKSGLSFRFSPLYWRLETGFSAGLNGYLSAYNKLGPFHLYSHEWVT